MGIQPQEAVGYNMQSLSLWECAVCSVPDPREMDNASSFFPPPEKLSVWQYLVWLATPGASVRHLWASKKKHTGRGRFPPCVAPEVLEQILGLISSHDFLDTTGACLLVIRPLDNLPRGGGRTSWMSNETILCDLERRWQHDVLFKIWKKPQLYWWILIFTERAAACQQYSLLVCTWGYP